jgi:hypothetical protein
LSLTQQNLPVPLTADERQALREAARMVEQLRAVMFALARTGAISM